MNSGEANTRERLKRLTRKIKEFPTLPAVVNTITRMMQNPKTSAVEISKAIQKDQVLTGKVLRMVNSAYYGFPRRISTIRQAIVILGFQNIRNLILTTSVLKLFGGKGKSGFDREKFWDHSLGVAVASRIIARRCGIGRDEEIFVMGLMHDIGKLVMDQHLTDEFSRAINLSKNESILISEAEEKIFGISHCQLGYWLTENWNLPLELTDVILHHHNPKAAKTDGRMVSTVHIADIVCRSIDIGNGGDDCIPLLEEDSWNRLGLRLEILREILESTDAEMQSARQFMEIARE